MGLTSLKQQIKALDTYGSAHMEPQVLRKDVLGLLADYTIVKKDKASIKHLREIAEAILVETHVCMPRKQLEELLAKKDHPIYLILASTFIKNYLLGDEK